MASTDIPQHWALALSERCRRYGVLPGPGGAYDQDEYLMAVMEHAAGASALFDADSKTTLRYLDIHTRFGEEATRIIQAVNDREKREKPQSSEEPVAETAGDMADGESQS